jgi:hypothetical protein
MIRSDAATPRSPTVQCRQGATAAILGYAAIAATVGLVLKRMKDDDNLLMRLLGSGPGAAWTLATFLVVPVLVSQNVGPIDALKQVPACSSAPGRERDRQRRHRRVLRLLSFSVILVGVLRPTSPRSFRGVGDRVGWCSWSQCCCWGVYQAALSGIYSAALYRYATQGEAPAAFQGLQLQHAFQAK